MFKIDVRHIIHCGLIIVGLVFTFLTIFGNHWISTEWYTIGLWNMCWKTECMKMEEKFGYIEFLTITKTFVIVGCFTYTVGLVLSLLYYLKKIENNKIAGFALFTSGLCLVIGLSVFTNDTEISYLISRKQFVPYNYGWSYITGWVSAVISIISGIGCFVKKVENYSLFF